MARMGRPILGLIWSVPTKKKPKQEKSMLKKGTQTRNKIVTPVSEVQERRSRDNHESERALDAAETSLHRFASISKVSELDEVEHVRNPARR